MRAIEKHIGALRLQGLNGLNRVPEVADARQDDAVLVDGLVDLRGDHLDPREAAADQADALGRRHDGHQDDLLLLHVAHLREHLDGCRTGVPRGQDGVHEQHVALRDVEGQLLVEDVQGPGARED